jgi:hypothetical protein
MKKILSLVLALLMSASAASFVGAAEEAAIAPEDTAVAATTAVSDAEAEAQAQYADALALLGSWNILHGKGENNPAAADPIKRYEMALFVSRISTGWTDDSKWAVADQWYDRDHDTSGFDDLEGSGAINVYGALSYASQKGIILGYGNRKFGPEDGITYQDALTMAVRTLGYFNLAWPWGNIEKAVTLGLTKGIPSSVKYTDILNRGQVAQIIYNALFATTKDGDTLAARNFNGDLDWKTIIITVAGKGYFTTDNEKIPAGYLNDKPLGFRVVKENGELDSTPYWVKNAQSFKFEDRIENYLGYAYKALFTVDEGNLATVEMIKPLAEEPVWNWGVTNGDYPITNYLSNYELVSKYNKNTYLNSWNSNYGYYEFILMDALQGKDSVKELGNKYGVDWSAAKKGNILERVAKTDDADYVVEINGEKAYFKTAWYWNDVLNAYFHYVYKDVDSKLEVVGIDILDEEDIAKMIGAVYTETVQATKGSHGLKFITSKDATKTAYASLIPFALNNSPRANYGIFEEYSLGQFTDAKIKCPKDDADKAGFKIYRLNSVSKIAETLFADKGYTDADWPNVYNTNWTKTTAHEGIYEGACDHSEYAFYWLNEEYGLPKPVDGSYVIYSVDEGTGEIKIVKVIYDITNEKADATNFVATGVVRGYNIGTRTVTIGDKSYTFDYDSLKDVGLKLDTSKVDRKAEFTYLFKTLFNQYVTYVICDGKLVHIELAGKSSDLIVVDSYAGLSSDGYIVVNGYDTKDLQYRQYRIGSYNGWVKGDYYYYPNQATVDAAFVRGTIYTINSYNEGDDVYYVSTVALRYLNPDDQTLNYDVDELIQKGILADGKTVTVTLNEGYKSFGGDYSKAKSTDKYILICNPLVNWYGKDFFGNSTTNGVDAKYPHDLEGKDLYGLAGGDYAPIIVYVGVGGANWTATGNPVKTGDTTILLNVDFYGINGFNKDQYDISYVLFQTWDYETAAYDGANATGWYLLGASNYTARCFNLYTGAVGTYTAVNKDLRLGYAYPAIGKTIVNDVPYDAVRLNVALPGAYESGSKYVFGHGTMKGYEDVLWSADKVSQKILSHNDKLVPATLGKEVKGLTGGTSVYLVSTYDGLYGGTKFELDKISDKEFAAWLEKNNYDAATVSFWYVHTVGGNTVFYIAADGDAFIKEDYTLKTSNLVDVTNDTTKDYAYIETILGGTQKEYVDDNEKKYTVDATIDNITLDFIGASVAEKKTDTHHAIDTNDFHFGYMGYCDTEDWETDVTLSIADDANEYRIYGSIFTLEYDPHNIDETVCDLIKAVKINLATEDAKIVNVTTGKVVENAKFSLIQLDDTGKAQKITVKVVVKDSNGTKYDFTIEITPTLTVVNGYDTYTFEAKYVSGKTSITAGVDPISGAVKIPDGTKLTNRVDAIL